MFLLLSNTLNFFACISFTLRNSSHTHILFIPADCFLSILVAYFCFAFNRPRFHIYYNYLLRIQLQTDRQNSQWKNISLPSLTIFDICIYYTFLHFTFHTYIPALSSSNLTIIACIGTSGSFTSTCIVYLSPFYCLLYYWLFGFVHQM